jgi:hypothetical protein
MLQLFTFYKTSHLNEVVHCTQPSLSVSVLCLVSLIQPDTNGEIYIVLGGIEVYCYGFGIVDTIQGKIT